MEPVVFNLEGDLSRVSGRVEIVLTQDHQDISVNNAPAGINMKVTRSDGSQYNINSYPKQ